MKTPLLMLCLLLTLVGCQSGPQQANDEEKLRAAFLAGQQSAQAQFQQQRSSGISVIGEVRKNKILWRPGLTLAQGIVEAEFVGAIQPRAIFVVRGGTRYEVNMRSLLNGQEDPELQPGDVIDIRR